MALHRILYILRWMDERLSENAARHGAHLAHQPFPLVVRNPLTGPHLVTPRVKTPRPHRG